MLTSAYGLTLLTKLALTGPLLAAAFVNARVVSPVLSEARDPRPVLARLCRALEVEVVAGVLVIAVAGVLAAVAPPGADGALRLTRAEARALATPRLPATSIDDPMTWIGAPTRTLGDLRYAEFTHAWSGVIVCLLGLAWLVQQRGGRLGRPAGWLWPAILLPFAAFVVVASDPEVWPLGPVAIRKASPTRRSSAIDWARAWCCCSRGSAGAPWRGRRRTSRSGTRCPRS